MASLHSRRRRRRRDDYHYQQMHPSDWQIFRVYLILVSTSLIGCYGLISYVASTHRYNEARLRELANINATDIEYITEPQLVLRNNCLAELCPSGKDVSWHLVIFVKSSATHSLHREIIRRTWARWGFVDGGHFSTLFVIGGNEDPYASEILKEEKRRYTDILHYDGPDDYKNIAFKTLIGMRWAVENLPRNYYYASADDDFLVNIAKMQETIDSYRDFMVKNGTNIFPIICMFDGRDKAKPFRDKISKWYISMEEYRWPEYPKFCMGGMYVTSLAMVRDLWEISQLHRPMRVDDVWITGILRKKLGVPADFVTLLSDPVAHHYLGFKVKADLTSQGTMMQDEWTKLLALAENKTVCTC
uniref:Hexosyltransferase n=1 Tax=Phallusia mammillata TaxID=59560 RepID=A0A6F9D7I1_9ASCI|nr:beta-1,3-galactosyltransferase 5-like [Phallusia mammillata]